ncbi:MAG: hypothetical protein ACOYMF_01510 [Bacteroidales bacterium]
MKDKIIENKNQPEELERLYRSDKNQFGSAFEDIYPEVEKSELVNFWKIRLAFDKAGGKIKSFRWADIVVLIVACFITSVLIKFPEIYNNIFYNEDYYMRNAGLIVLFGLSIFAVWTNKIFSPKKIIFIVLAFLVSAIYINLLPSVRNSQSLNLAFIHLPLLMWCIYGLVYINLDVKDNRKRIDFIKYNGDIAVLGALILIAGGILTGITIGLFSAIDIHIEHFYMEYIAICGLVSAPIVATYIIQNYPSLTNKLAPIIANIFSPLVLITLIVYLVTIPVSGKSPYASRDILLIFNLMLLGVMGIIIFSISETSQNKKQRFNEMILFILSIVTLIIDAVALSAIFYRLYELGITPNRMVVFSSNLLIFINLILITIDLFNVNFRKADTGKVELTISKYLPLYAVYTFLIVFGFPLIFGMK